MAHAVRVSLTGNRAKLSSRLMDRITVALARKLEPLLLRGPAGRLRFPPVFVVGPPRCGSTLLTQVLLTRFRFATVTNWVANFPDFPYLASLMARARFGVPPSTGFTSSYGTTQGPTGPHEAGAMWYRWFPKDPPHAGRGSLTSSSLAEIRRTVAGISNAWKAPALFKNLYNSARLAPLAEALPEAVFLVCKRDVARTAYSILRGRIEKYGNKDAWFSVPPRNAESIRSRPYWEQVVEQVRGIYADIREDAGSIGPARFLEVSYEALCEHPASVLDVIGTFCNARGIALTARDTLPDTFDVERPSPQDDDWNLVSACARSPA